MRWHGRMLRNELPVGKPGPPKVELPDYDAVNRGIKLLKHGRKRTAGTGRLYLFFKRSISRRDLERLVKEARRKKLEEMKHIEWLIPGMVWSMDDTLAIKEPQLYLHQVRDASSRYLFPPKAGELLSGKEVAANLRKLIWKFGPPLFMKRDNGSNLNAGDVDEVMKEHWMIPLNSPPYYPQYNGGVENSQYEIKEELVNVEPGLLQLWALNQAQDLNHRRRRVLGGKTSCEIFYSGKIAMRTYDRRQRKGVYDEIVETALRIAEKVDEETELTLTAAWRVSVDNWLRRNGAITVSSAGRVSPDFQQIRSHN